MSSKLDTRQIFQESFDEVVKALKVKIESTQMSIALSAAEEDSVVAVQGIEPRGSYDKIEYAYPDTVTVVKTYTLDAVPVGTVTEVYTDATHTRLVSQTRS
jgi:phosphomevalonate kinase